ncbi:MAG TPA: T9SS type A sorting domain-containing protein [candidate division WOR-3 bacterium]|uniref:T9SS type A sorting domain-containing protein n=1 Tax=candidate division WOR-3 bacterium TaxID=2052148 RepID=A0A7C0VBM2_UNCW3|nr:T9SS type A sorting domain-containing protein [candidate division WOR-3 bacterium]
MSGRRLALFLFLPLLIFGWTTPINISNTDSLSNYPAMTMDKRGWLHCVWEDKTPGNYEIFYTFYNGTTWAVPQNISQDSNTSWTPDVAVDTLNRVHIVWGNYETGRIMWTMFEGDTWTTPISISLPGYACQGPELAVNPLNNEVHCVWHSLTGAEDSEIWHSFFNGDTWSTPENVSNDNVGSAWADIAIDSLGRIDVVWMDYGTFDIFYSRFDSVSWSSPVNISNLSGQSCDPRIGIDRDNNPRVVWEERDSAGYEVYYTYFDGTGWMNPIWVDSIDAHEPDIAVGVDNKAYIVYLYDYEIYYVVYKDTVQETLPIDISNTGDAILPSICIDSLYAHVIWSDGSMDSSTPEKRAEIFYVTGTLSGINERIGVGKNKKISYSSFVVSTLYLSFSPQESSNAFIRIYDIAGRKVKEVSLGRISRGSHQYRISLNTASGVYFFEIRAGSQKWWGRFILINP